jgi:hypothetical protein
MTRISDGFGDVCTCPGLKTHFGPLVCIREVRVGHAVGDPWLTLSNQGCRTCGAKPAHRIRRLAATELGLISRRPSAIVFEFGHWSKTQIESRRRVARSNLCCRSATACSGLARDGRQRERLERLNFAGSTMVLALPSSRHIAAD